MNLAIGNQALGTPVCGPALDPQCGEKKVRQHDILTDDLYDVPNRKKIEQKTTDIGITSLDTEDVLDPDKLCPKKRQFSLLDDDIDPPKNPLADLSGFKHT